MTGADQTKLGAKSTCGTVRALVVQSIETNTAARNERYRRREMHSKTHHSKNACSGLCSKRGEGIPYLKHDAPRIDRPYIMTHAKAAGMAISLLPPTRMPSTPLSMPAITLRMPVEAGAEEAVAAAAAATA